MFWREEEEEETAEQELKARDWEKKVLGLE